METETNYCWHGEPVEVKFGYCNISENTEKPMYWYNYECRTSSVIGSALIPAIYITSKDGQQWVIANHFGIGIYKLLQGGWPNCTHFSLDKNTFKEAKEKYFAIREFDHDAYSEHESARRKWQKREYPEEFEKMESLRKLATKYQ